MQETLHKPGEFDHDPTRPQHADVTTKLAAVELPYGRFAARRAADGGERAALPETAADVTSRARGFVIDPATFDPHAVSTGTVVETGDPASLLRRGRVWVPVESSVSQDGAVFARFTPGPGGSDRGAVRGDADGGTCAAVPRANFEIGGSRSALVSINL